MHWSRCAAAFGQLPGWLQWMLLPVLGPVEMYCRFPRVVIVFPIPRLVIVFPIAAIFLVWLKLGYLKDQLTWGSIPLVVLAPIWMPILFGYVFLLWVSLGAFPLAAFIYWRQWRDNKPFCIRDPEVSLLEETRSRLRDDTDLTRDDLQSILGVMEANEVRLRVMLRVGAVASATVIIGLAVAVGFGFDNERAIRLGFFLCVSTFLPVIFLIDQLPHLRCRQCEHLIAGHDLRRMSESGTCPRCLVQATLFADSNATEKSARHE
jgi:hypothetical protein